MSARTAPTEAVLLRSVDYRDSDRIVTLLTAAHGKVAVLARSARKSRKRFAGSLEPCSVIVAEVGFGSGDVGRLSSATVVRAFPNILSDLVRITLAGAGLSLVREVVPEREPDARLFSTVVTFLELLDELPTVPQAALLSFCVRVLSLSGFEPGVDACGRCGKRAPQGQAALFDPASGAVVCRACGGGPHLMSGASRSLIARWASGQWTLLDGWDLNIHLECSRVVTAFAEHHLGRELPGLRPLNHLD